MNAPLPSATAHPLSRILTGQAPRPRREGTGTLVWTALPRPPASRRRWVPAEIVLRRDCRAVLLGVPPPRLQ